MESIAGVDAPCLADPVHGARNGPRGRTSSSRQESYHSARSSARVLRSKRKVSQVAGIARGRPLSSIATKVKFASVTFSWMCVWKRRAQASTWIFIEVRPIDSTSV